MTPEEKERTRQFSSLKRIRPREEWVARTKMEILGMHEAPQPSPQRRGGFVWEMGNVLALLRRPVVLMPVLIAMVGSAVVADAARTSLPGDRLYTVRSIIERGQFALSQQESDQELYLQIARHRLDDLKVIAHTNRVRNLHATIEAFQGSMAEVSRDFDRLAAEEPERALQRSRELVQLRNDQEEVEQLLGTRIGQDAAYESATRLFVRGEIASLEGLQLTETQKELLAQAEEYMEEGRYREAERLIVEIETAREAGETEESQPEDSEQEEESEEHDETDGEEEQSDEQDPEDDQDDSEE